MIITVIVAAGHPLDDIEGLLIGWQIKGFQAGFRGAGFKVSAVRIAVGLKGLGTKEIKVVEIPKTVPGLVNAKITQNFTAPVAIRQCLFARFFFLPCFRRIEPLVSP